MEQGARSSTTMSTTTAHIRLLLHLDRLKRSERSGRRTAFAIVLPLTNLFFCAYYERFLTSAADRSALDLFLTVQCVVLALLATVHFVSSLREIAHNIRLLPVRTPSLVLAVPAALLRDPLALGILATGIFGLVIMLHPEPATIPLLIAAVVLLGAGIHTLVGSALLVASARSDRAAGITLLGLLALLATLLWSLSFRADALPLLLPPVLWASAATEAALHGTEAWPAWALLTAFPLLILWGTVRWMERT
jgi:hypothetical protein